MNSRINRRSLVAGAAVAPVAAILPAEAKSDNVSDSTPATRMDLETFVQAPIGASNDVIAYCLQLANELVATIRTNLRVSDRRDGMGVVASHLLSAGLDELGDLYGDTGEPVGSVVDHVLNQFMALSGGNPRVVDIRLPVDSYRDYNEAWDAVRATFTGTEAGPMGVLGHADDASMNLVTEANYQGARLGAHLAVGLMNATRRGDTLAIARNRQVD